MHAHTSPQFNAIRLLFNHEHVMKNDIVTAPDEEPLLFQVRYLEMFAIIASEAAKRGILILLACHRIKHDAWPGKGLWYDDSIGYPESRVRGSVHTHCTPHTLCTFPRCTADAVRCACATQVLESWSVLARALCGMWNVFARATHSALPHRAPFTRCAADLTHRVWHRSSPSTCRTSRTPPRGGRTWARAPIGDSPPDASATMCSTGTYTQCTAHTVHLPSVHC